MRQKTIHGIFKVSEPPWHEHVLLNSQSRQIQWRGGGRNLLTQRQIAGESSQKPAVASHRKQEVFYRVFVQSCGERWLLQTVTPRFSRLWLCYETCESTRTKQTWENCFSAESRSRSASQRHFWGCTVSKTFWLYLIALLWPVERKCIMCT